MILMILSVWVSSRISKIIFTAVFLVIAIIMAITSDRENVVGNILILGIALMVSWLRINKSVTDYAGARTFLLDRLNQKQYTTCKICGSQLSYHRKPKNLSQLMTGGLTCQNCGAKKTSPLMYIFLDEAG
jgi:hypothetical protein